MNEGTKIHFCPIGKDLQILSCAKTNSFLSINWFMCMIEKRLPISHSEMNGGNVKLKRKSKFEDKFLVLYAISEAEFIHNLTLVMSLENPYLQNFIFKCVYLNCFDFKHTCQFFGLISQHLIMQE